MPWQDFQGRECWEQEGRVASGITEDVRHAGGEVKGMNHVATHT